MKLTEYIEKNNVKKNSAIIEIKDSKSYLALNMTIMDKQSTWRFGSFKGKQLLANLDAFIEDFENFDVNSGVWTTTFTIQSDKFATKPMKLNANHLAALYLFKTDIEDFVTKSTMRGPREAIEKPVVIETVNGFQVNNVLLIPAFPKQDGDTGKGLIPWHISVKKARQLVNYAFEGDMETVAEEWNRTHPEEDLVWHAKSLLGEPYDVTYNPDMVRAYLKYRKDIEKFERANRV